MVKHGPSLYRFLVGKRKNCDLKSVQLQNLYCLTLVVGVDKRVPTRHFGYLFYNFFLHKHANKLCFWTICTVTYIHIRYTRSCTIERQFYPVRSSSAIFHGLWLHKGNSTCTSTRILCYTST